MEFVELNNGSILEIRVSEQEQDMLRDLDKEGGRHYLPSNAAEWEFFEGPLSNSEYNWVDPADTGDLTSAPMLGRLDEDGEISHRWAFMEYQTDSLLERLMVDGQIQLVGGSLTDSKQEETAHPNK